MTFVRNLRNIAFLLIVDLANKWASHVAFFFQRAAGFYEFIDIFYIPVYFSGRPFFHLQIFHSSE